MSGGAREKALRQLLENKEQIVGVITPYLTDSNRRFENVIKTAVEYGVAVFPVSKDTFEETISRLQYDILISCGFPYLIPASVINKSRYAINVHPTLLPKYRGFRSGAHVLINGEEKTGVTVHFVQEEFDKGDIIAQEEILISPFDTPRSIYRKSQDIEPKLLLKVIQQLKTDNFEVQPQNEFESSSYNKIRTPEDSLVDANLPLKQLYNFIRACDPEHYPAHFYINGEKVCIKLWRPTKSETEADMI